MSFKIFEKDRKIKKNVNNNRTNIWMSFLEKRKMEIKVSNR